MLFRFLCYKRATCSRLSVALVHHILKYLTYGGSQRLLFCWFKISLNQSEKHKERSADVWRATQKPSSASLFLLEEANLPFPSSTGHVSGECCSEGGCVRSLVGQRVSRDMREAGVTFLCHVEFVRAMSAVFQESLSRCFYLSLK